MTNALMAKLEKEEAQAEQVLEEGIAEREGKTPVPEDVPVAPVPEMHEEVAEQPEPEPQPAPETKIIKFPSGQNDTPIPESAQGPKDDGPGLFEGLQE